MTRTWAVYIEQGIGHECHNTITFSDWYGPYTREQAERLAANLNTVLHDDEDSEHPIATAMPLNNLLPREVVKKIKAEGPDFG